VRVTIYTSDRGRVTVESMPDAGAAQLVEAFRDDPDAIFTITLAPDGITHINGRHIVRIDLDPETDPWGNSTTQPTPETKEAQ